MDTEPRAWPFEDVRPVETFHVPEEFVARRGPATPKLGTMVFKRIKRSPTE